MADISFQKKLKKEIASMWDSIRNNPVIAGEAVRNVILLAIAFGVTITAEQLTLIMAVIGSFIALLTRQATVANSRVDTKVAEMVAHREVVGSTGTGDGMPPPKARRANSEQRRV